ncbi:CASP8-associated protein 2 [Lacerta agilis]|uniref:CASP8-associated protein 2 n=1 Tax=Lacerta agilis TaxID=80427 RepID=UPI0014194CE8|nr:CASP8-associated protein 2 [Lacerta agilis]
MATDDDDDGMTFSNLLHGVSSQGVDDDESSVDIYDGLDSSPVISVKPATKLTPSISSLNLFDEILIEEGTAKEATYNDLQAEHEKCQQQLQELTRRFQQIQEQNSALQNENQSLKKNISALLKTARVEINRKDEEINNLQRRLTEFQVHPNTYGRTYFPASTNNARNFEGSKLKNKCRDLVPENNSRTDSRTTQALPKDKPCGYPPWDTENKKLPPEKGDTLYISQSHPEQLCSDGTHARLASVDSSYDREKGGKEMKHNEHHSSENNYKYKTKAHPNLGSTLEGKLDPHGRLEVNPDKTVKNGLWKDKKDLKLRSSPHTEKRTGKVPSAREKQPTPKDTSLSKPEHSNSDRSEKSQNKNQNDLKLRNKEESNNGQKNRQPDSYLDQRRTGKVSGPPEWNKIARSPPKISKTYVEDRKRKHRDCRRNKEASGPVPCGGKPSPLAPPPVLNKEPKHSHPKQDSSKSESEHTRSKSGRHRTEEKRKNERDNSSEARTSQNEKRESKEPSPQTGKGAMKIKDSAKREKKKFFQSVETAKVVEGLEEEVPIKGRREEEQSKSKDLKLSFMQTLNLTLSPAKKQTDKCKAVARSTNKCGTEIPGQEAMLVPAEAVGANTIKQTQTPLLPICDNPVQTKSEQVMPLSEVKTKVGNEGLPETLNTKPLNTPSDPQDIAVQWAPDDVKLLPEAKTGMEEAGGVDEMHVASGLESPLDQDTLPDNTFNDVETISSVDFDSFSVIDEISGTDSDSIDEKESSNWTDENVFECPEKENKPVPQKATVEEGKILSGGHLKPSFPDRNHENRLETLYNEGLKPTSQARETSRVSVDDDNSILSIDLNHMRNIPKPISPLNSPMRPLAKVPQMESPYKGHVKSYNTDFVPESAVVYPGRNQSSELNKENQKPLCSDHQILEESQLSMSSDELEEGEIVSDNDEPKIETNSENSKKTRRKASPDRSNLAKSTCNHKARTTSSREDTGKLSSGGKNKENPKDGTIMRSNEVKKMKTVSIDSLEKIVQIIVVPSTVHEFMQMLKAIRKQVRKSYMKFKIQFPVQHFHRIIDSAILNFTSLVKYIDFSKMSKSSEALKLNLCEVIEYKLNRIKENSAIEHLFEQQQSDMKKKLWKLVDEQLDYLFDKIKRIILKLCTLVSFGNESEEGKLDKRKKEIPKCLINHKNKIDRQKSKKPALNARMQKPEECAPSKPVAGNQLLKRGHHDTNKMSTHKNVTAKCRSSYVNPKHSRTEAEPFKESSVSVTSLNNGKNENERLHMIGDSHKSDISCGPLTEQQMSGLTFNLVNDAQMGEMFKSLLQGSDLSDKNGDFIGDNQWEFRTPEKHTPDGQNCVNEPPYETEEQIPRETGVESRVLDGIKWPIVSPERDSAFLARLQMPIDPDILDESCMFEIPTSPALKKGEECISEKPKSLVSSILLEDLAVSLTIPSPLKSDAHLSFLKPDMYGSVPEDVLSAHFSEDAHLEEEDASEQDIHLALESDNSSSKSSCSSSWASIPPAPGFQYCPSLPMQAVIMEKSNDHFIVKIRRAAPSTSPVLEQSTLANEPLTSSSGAGNKEIVLEEKIDTLDLKSIPLEDTATSKENLKIIDFEGKPNDVGKRQVTHLLGFEKEPPLCLANDHIPHLSEPQQEPHSDAPNETLESVEDLFRNAREERPCNLAVSELHQERYTNASQTQGPDLLGPYQVLHSGAGPEEASDLQEPPKEMGRTLESSIKTSHHEDTPEVLKLPQAHTAKVFQKRDASCAELEHSPISCAAVSLVEKLSSETHFDICVDLTDETAIENEVDSWDLTVEHASNARMGGLCKDKEEEKTVNHHVADDHPKHDVEAVVNLTEHLPDKCTADENFETGTTLNTGGLGCETKERKKRKKETEETSSAKRQRKESCELACKNNSKRSKEITSVTTSTSSNKTASAGDKDSLPSTSSLTPSSLCAKNIIKKKGEVVISWTRNDDREILLECQKKGPSGKTFASVAVRLNKSPAQVEERFKQLLKLFKMSNCS